LRPKAEDRNKVDFKMLRIVAVVVALAASACAFVAPVATQSASSPLKMSDKPFAGEVGAQVPLGFWDPLGLLKNADQERFDRLRYVELKHGRVAMLAVLGQIWTKSGKTFPGTIDYAGTKFSDVPTGYKGLLAMPGEGLGQIILFIGFLELFVMKDVNGTGEFPGDFLNGLTPPYWTNLSPEAKLRKRAIELNNGRAAQMGILALMVHEELGVSLWPGGI